MRRVSHPLSLNSSPSEIDVDESDFDRTLASFDASTVFVHVGLSDIKRAFQRDPYDFLLQKLLDHFETVIAPGFTPSFRSSGVYHKKFSKPEYGMFSKLFLNDCDYRTDDAIHSVLVLGDRRFDGCDHSASFGESSCWAEFDEENTLILNIGTDKFLSTQLYYIEIKNDVPYVAVPEYEGVVYYDEQCYERRTQMNHGYDDEHYAKISPNWRKIGACLESRGVLEDHSSGGLKVYAFRARDMRKAIEDHLKSDEYFIVT